VLPIVTDGRPDGGTDYYMEPNIAELFAAPRAGDRREPRAPRRHG
jgi:hypothetical protein